MTTEVSLSTAISRAALARRLQPREIREAGWTFWELRTLGIHRVVALNERQTPVPDASALDLEIRAVSRHFQRAWWRGLAYGVAVDVPSLQMDAEQLETLVDVHDNRKGALQWVILVARSSSLAMGCHTWIEGYLSPVYRAILRGLEEQGFNVGRTTKAKSLLMTLLPFAGGPRFQDFDERG